MTSAAGLPDFDVYAALGVDRDATVSQIKSAYRQRAKECHPDVAAHGPAAEARMKRVNQARDVLLDPTQRRLYDSLHAVAGSATSETAGRRRPTAGSPAPGARTERARRERAEEERRQREAERRRREEAERRRRAQEAAARAAREAAAREEREHREREAAERAERERRARERAAQAARERRARAAAERAARQERAGQLQAALLRDDIDLLAQIVADGVVDWSRQRPSARAQAERAAERVAAVAELEEAVRSGDPQRVRSARRTAALAGAEVRPDLRAWGRTVYRTVPVPPAPQSRAPDAASARPHDDSEERTSTPPTPPHPRDGSLESAQAQLRSLHAASVWPDAARAWMAIRAKWADQVTQETRAMGEEAVEHWGASLRMEERL